MEFKTEFKTVMESSTIWWVICRTNEKELAENRRKHQLDPSIELWDESNRNFPVMVFDEEERAKVYLKVHGTGYILKRVKVL